MKKYAPVPMWWYAAIFLAIFGLSIAFLYVYDTGLPWYGMILALAIVVVLFVPTGIMMALCNIQLSTSVIAALVAGYAWPGRMMNNVVFKVFALVSSTQGLGYIKDMKIGYYMVGPVLAPLVVWENRLTTTMMMMVENPTQDYIRCAMHRHSGLVVNPNSREYLGHGACRGDVYPGRNQQRTPAPLPYTNISHLWH